MDLLLLALGLSVDLCRFGYRFLIRHSAAPAENIFLRKQLAMYVERDVKPRRATARERLALVFLAHLFDWRDVLLIVTPRTFKSWQTMIERRYWRSISQPIGRPPLSSSVRKLIQQIAQENPQWSCGQIARVIEVQLGTSVDEKTVRKYLPLSDPRRRRARRGDQSWATFVRNQSAAIAACDFVSVMTVRFRIIYIFVLIEVGSRRILHIGVTEHPTAQWTAQQVRDAIPSSSPIKYLVHDGAGMFNDEFRAAARRLGVEPLRTPPYSPKANAFCERLIGTLRRECLDWFIPLSENHIRTVVREWAAHYNRARPHMSLGPNVPEPGEHYPAARLPHRHRIPDNCEVVSTSVLGGLHHEYRLEKRVA